MTPEQNHLPYGSRRRRVAQLFGFVYNDDGTWSPLRLKTAKGEEAIAKEQERYPQDDKQE